MRSSHFEYVHHASRRVLLLVLFLAVVLPFTSATAKGKRSATRQDLCYAFMRNGDLWTVCQGKRERLDIHGKLRDFAISADGYYFAIQENSEPSGIGRTKQLLVSLNPRVEERSRQVDYPESLYSTCGTIISVQYGNLRSFDLIKSQSIRVPPYKYFRCSSDQHATAGWTEQDDEERLKHAKADPGLSAQITLTVIRDGKQNDRNIYYPLAFDVSPKGEQVAYFAVPKRGPGPNLCVEGPSGYPSCVLGMGHWLSVSDAGDVIYAADEVGIEFWHPGLKQTVLLERGEDASQPQWITPKIAAALHEWGKCNTLVSCAPD